MRTPRCDPSTHAPPATTRDRGVIAPIEVMFVLAFLLASVGLIGFLGRLHAAGVQLGNTSQAAARAASMEGGPIAARRAAETAVDASTLRGRCVGAPSTELVWQPSPTGTWQGGSVTVTVSCTVTNEGLAGMGVPGTRTLRASDTQPIDRYQR